MFKLTHLIILLLIAFIGHRMMKKEEFSNEDISCETIDANGRKVADIEKCRGCEQVGIRDGWGNENSDYFCGQDTGGNFTCQRVNTAMNQWKGCNVIPAPELERRAKKAQEEADKRRAQEEAARRRAQEEADKRRAQEEAARRRAQEEAARRRAQEEADKRRAQEAADRRRAQASATVTAPISRSSAQYPTVDWSKVRGMSGVNFGAVSRYGGGNWK